jgi:hypothetical protein
MEYENKQNLAIPGSLPRPGKRKKLKWHFLEKTEKE